MAWGYWFCVPCLKGEACDIVEEKKNSRKKTIICVTRCKMANIDKLSQWLKQAVGVKVDAAPVPKVPQKLP